MLAFLAAALVASTPDQQPARLDLAGPTRETIRYDFVCAGRPYAVSLERILDSRRGARMVATQVVVAGAAVSADDLGRLNTSLSSFVGFDGLSLNCDERQSEMLFSGNGVAPHSVFLARFSDSKLVEVRP